MELNLPGGGGDGDIDKPDLSTVTTGSIAFWCDVCVPTKLGRALTVCSVGASVFANSSVVLGWPS